MRHDSERNRPNVGLGSSLNEYTFQRRTQEFMPLKIILLVAVLVAFTASCRDSSQSVSTVSLQPQWHEFQGTWTATGSRNSVRLAQNRIATVSTLNGSLLLAGSSRPAVGFRSEAIVFNDTETGLVGRAVWTDERGDCAYSELRGEGNSTSNKITGTFVGGTGRYSGASGTYEFSWRFLVENEDGNIQGQSVGLVGKVKVDSDHNKPKGDSRS
jgi:hypothetical protein